jgi:hypothetical protein
MPCVLEQHGLASRGFSYPPAVASRVDGLIRRSLS